MQEKRSQAEMEKELAHAKLLLSQLLPSDISSPLGPASMARMGLFLGGTVTEYRFDCFDTKQVDQRVKLRAKIASLERELLEIAPTDQFQASSSCVK